MSPPHVLRLPPRAPAFALPPAMTAAGAAPAQQSGAVALASAALSIAPIRRAVMAAGRAKVIADARRIGVPWEEDVAALRALIPSVLEPLRASIADPALVLPEYYLAPFHAYPEGNLGWMPALEAEVSSSTVHAKFPDVEPLEGDGYLRGRAADIMCERWASARPLGGAPPAAVLDIGCSVGLSSAILKQRWPGADVVGLDPSAEMLAVATHRRGDVRYVHGLGECVPDAAVVEGGLDVVSVQLVVHELPDAPARAIFGEAMRLLKPGGMLVCMDVDPTTFSSVPPLVMTLFQSTEPYFQDHSARDIGAEITRAGFSDVEFERNTPRHRTYTAFKP